MKDAEFYKTHLEELIHFMRTSLTTLSLASKTLAELSNDGNVLNTSEEFSTSLELIQSSVRKISQYVDNVDNKI